MLVWWEVTAKGNPPSKELEFKFAGRSPKANTKVKRGSTVAVSIYQKFEDAAQAGSSITPDTSLFTAELPEMTVPPGTVPHLIGLTLEQATGRLPNNIRLAGDEVGGMPPKPERA